MWGAVPPKDTPRITSPGGGGHPLRLASGIDMPPFSLAAFSDLVGAQALACCSTARVEPSSSVVPSGSHWPGWNCLWPSLCCGWVIARGCTVTVQTVQHGCSRGAAVLLVMEVKSARNNRVILPFHHASFGSVDLQPCCIEELRQEIALLFNKNKIIFIEWSHKIFYSKFFNCCSFSLIHL